MCRTAIALYRIAVRVLLTIPVTVVTATLSISNLKLIKHIFIAFHFSLLLLLSWVRIFHNNNLYIICVAMQLIYLSLVDMVNRSFVPFGALDVT